MLQKLHILIFLVLLPCCSIPDAESFVAPEMESVEVVESGCFGVELRCSVGLGLPEGIECGFYLTPLPANLSANLQANLPAQSEATAGVASGLQGAIEVQASISGNAIVANVEGLSSGCRYECSAYIRKGEYEKLSGSIVVKTEEPFKDEVFRSYVLANFDTDRDGGISQREALDVDTIKVVTENIADLAGIGIFTNLYYLYCAGISEDKFKFDAGLEGALTALDVSKNTKLNNLICGHNKITELNLQNNRLLRYLDCNNTLITTLDLSNNKNIEILEAHDCNHLTEIKFAQGGNIRSIFMCNCNLMQVDISMLPYIDSFNCSYSQHLDTLDFSANRYLKVLGVAGLPQLKILDLSNNEFINNIDCDYCDNLETIYLHKDAKLERIVKPDHTKVVYVEN